MKNLARAGWASFFGVVWLIIIDNKSDIRVLLVFLVFFFLFSFFVSSMIYQGKKKDDK